MNLTMCSCYVCDKLSIKHILSMMFYVIPWRFSIFEQIKIIPLSRSSRLLFLYLFCNMYVLNWSLRQNLQHLTALFQDSLKLQVFNHKKSGEPCINWKHILENLQIKENVGWIGLYFIYCKHKMNVQQKSKTTQKQHYKYTIM